MPLLEKYYFETFQLKQQEELTIQNYVQYFLEKQNIKKLNDEEKKAVKDKWQKILTVFNENHKYLNYFIAIFRKRLFKEEPELFVP
ncbi:hypothetical protein CO180_03980 [candidate division WWE3 bacterium CG_4_9_14_3_um_filter_41_6]|uniref:Uncharacterized protein n=1 Tax=candidate division WWE3 bacterium CG_4_10_14_0_2_um_filter_41_14 TaxID=1975072 RepID=A0A2M7TER2_UNCKA|nr:MAG: hypothetical protein COY32_06860 [candidate division WWE3 bacterium CG_4_10_14_0_2_um_filter_41_14]PJA38243.1 MAG: hypothetical protein CO180_03980 [candidate division WWE3 bacterium CG_4_9_14_3_um_filter_41_6]